MLGGVIGCGVAGLGIFTGCGLGALDVGAVVLGRGRVLGQLGTELLGAGGGDACPVKRREGKCGDACGAKRGEHHGGREGVLSCRAVLLGRLVGPRAFDEAIENLGYRKDQYKL